MILVLRAAAGTVFTATVSLALGLCLLARLSIKLSRLERYLFGFLTGGAVLSLAVFLLTAAHLAYTPVFLVFGLAICGFSIPRLRRMAAPDPSPGEFPKPWFGFALVLCLPYMALYLSRALGPEYSADGTTYHLDMVARYLREHHFPRITNNMYANFPEALEMLFLSGFGIGKHSSAASTHLLFLFATAAALVGFGVRFRAAKAGIAAAVLFFLSPVVALDASTAYVDVAGACACFATFYALEVWRREGEDHWLAIAGTMAGFAGGVKYTGLVAIPFALAVVAWHLRRAGAPRWKRCLPLVLVPALLLVAPWLIKNTVEIGNPFSPFANRLFPNPYVHISFEDSYRQQLAHWNGATWAEVPLEATVLGVKLNGLLGPVFLLAPIALFAARTPVGRSALAAGLIFALPYPANLGARFLIPVLPFLSLAISIALSYWRSTLTVVLLFHFLVCYPRALEYYAPSSWRLDRMRWRETLRIRPETETLAERLEGYELAQFIDTSLPADARIFQVADLPRAYAKQVIDSYYGSALSEQMYFTLYSGVFPTWQPNVRRTFRFPPQRLRTIRVTQTAEPENQIWTIAELRLFHNDQEIMRTPRWKLTSRPFPWDIARAFDGNRLTSWRAWETARAGMFVEITFDEPVEADRVCLDGPHDQDGLQFLVSGEDETGQAVTLASQAAVEELSLPEGWRRLIGRELKSNGYTHFVIKQGVPGYAEVRQDPEGWGMKFLAQRGNYALYELR